METPGISRQLAVLEDPRGLVVRILTNITASNADDLRDAVLAAWQDKEKPGTVIIDLTGVGHIDSAGIGAVMDLAKRANTIGILFVLCGLEQGPRRMLARTGLAALFQISGSLDEALHP